MFYLVFTLKIHLHTSWCVKSTLILYQRSENLQKYKHIMRVFLIWVN